MFCRALYSCLLTLIAPFFIYALYKKKEGKPAFGHRWKEHFGITPTLPNNKSQPLWIHAVSVGEVIAAMPIIKAMKQQAPDQQILVTTTTSTGAEQVNKLGDLVEHRYMPLDFSFSVKSFLKATNPAQMLVMETELWPNTLYTVAKANIPITVMNARLSERSCQRYAKLKSIFRLLSDNLNQVLCQHEDDAKRFIRLGMSKDQVHVTGSVKFDIEVNADIQEKGDKLRQLLGSERPTWIAASTHQGEDEQILQAHQQILKTSPDALLILVPRHPERFKPMTALCQSEGFNVITRTSQMDIQPNTQIYLGDTMGEMLILIQAADICFMGGSLIGNKVGGHNLLEPAALGKPTITGPSYFNFADITKQLLEVNATSVCQNSDELTNQLHELFKKPEQIKQKGESALAVVERNKGAIANTLTFIL